MKYLWLILLLLAGHAYADNDQEPGQTARTVKPYPVRYPGVDTTKPGASLAIGSNALPYEYLPAAYQNLAIGENALSGVLGTAGVQNMGIGYNACGSMTTGSQNICLGNNAGQLLQSGLGNLLIGLGAGKNITTGSYNLIFDAANPTNSSCTNCTLNVLIGSNTGKADTNGSTVIGYDAGFNDTYSSGSSHQTIIGANVGGRNCGNGNASNNIVLVGASPTSGAILDCATTSTSNAIGIGQGYPGQFDTMVGWGALAANTVDSASQAAFGYNSLTLSNVASAENSAFGYGSCAAVTTGKNNVCMGYNSGATTLQSGSGNILIGSGTDTTAATTGSSASNMINIGNLIYYNNASTAVPVISACGTSIPAPESHSNNRSGQVTAGGGVVTSCTITFASAYNTWNHCRVTDESAVTSPAYSYTKSAITVTAGATFAGDIIDYDCDGY